MALNTLHPVVRDWFAAHFGAATEPQARLAGDPCGRERADFRAHRLRQDAGGVPDLPRRAGARRPRRAVSRDTTQVSYVSPLKALSNDIHKNLEVPLAGIARWRRERGLLLPPIRTAVRTGDTPTSRARSRCSGSAAAHSGDHAGIAVHPADGGAKPREMLRSVRTVIVDEIHAMADDKRGVAPGAVRWRGSTIWSSRAGGAQPQRIGLSATVRPIEEVARFSEPDDAAAIVDHRAPARDGSRGRSPQRRTRAGRLATRCGREIYDRLAELIREHRTTLVFVNTRRLSERVAHHLAERLGEDAVLPHHGSLSRTLRLDAEAAAEERRTAGRGRDGIARARHRHRHGGPGLPDRLAALDRGGAAAHRPLRALGGRTCRRAALRHHARRADRMRRAGARHSQRRARPARDSAQRRSTSWRSRSWPLRLPRTGDEDDLFALVRRAYPYRTLPRADFDAVSRCCPRASPPRAAAAARICIATA